MLKLQNIKGFIVILFIIFGLAGLKAAPIQADGHIPRGCPGGPPGQKEPGTSCPENRKQLASECEDPELNPQNCRVLGELTKVINVLASIVGVVIVIMIAVGGIQYSAARDNPQAAVAARTKIYNAVLALVVFLFSYSFLQWIVPGGIF